MQSAFAETVRPEIGKYVQGYQGQEGAIVWLMRIGPRAANEALVQISHVDNDVDGRIFRCKVQMVRDGEKSYTTEINGKSFELLRMKDGNGNLYMPDEPSSWWINYNDDLSKSDVANPDHFLTAYLEQDAKKQ
nr:hypothetical protein [Superficieibacter electus]